MIKKADITFLYPVFYLEGDLVFNNVMSVYEKSLLIFKRQDHLPQVTFDFSKLNSSDSSGLALILEWLKLSKKYQCGVQFVHLSPKIRAIARVAGIEDLVS